MTFQASPLLRKAQSRHGIRSDYGVGKRFLAGVAVVGLLVLGGGGWAATAELAGAVLAQGTVVVDQHVKKVQHRDGGIVADLRVQNGQHVNEGDLLLKLDETQTRAELAIIRSQLNELKGRFARTSAQSRGQEGVTFAPELLEDTSASQVVEGEARLFNESKKTLRGQLDQLGERIGQLEQEAKGLAVQRLAKQRELALVRKELEGVRELESKSLTPMTRVYALQREESRIDGEYGNLLAQEARVSGQINEIKMQMLSLEQNIRTEAQKELRSIEASLAELREKEVATKDRLSRMEVRAPISGTVHELSVFTTGGVVTPAEPVMLIVPEGDVLSVELKAAPSDINQIYAGQPVRLRFTSFNSRTTPEVAGKVLFVSADVSHDPRGRGDFYTVSVSVDLPGMKLEGKSLVPGMPVEAQISTEKRTALSYLVKPLADQFARSFKER